MDLIEISRTRGEKKNNTRFLFYISLTTKKYLFCAPVCLFVLNTSTLPYKNILNLNETTDKSSIKLLVAHILFATWKHKHMIFHCVVNICVHRYIVY